MQTPLSVFEFKRRSNPPVALAELFKEVRSAMRDGGELADFAKLFKGGTCISKEDAARLADLERQGVVASEFRVGSLPPELGPGLALMYDAALEVLRSSDRQIRTDRFFHPRSAPLLAEVCGSLLPVLGLSSVAALEMASTDSAYRSRLKERALQVSGVMELDDPPNPQCEFCTIVIEKEGEPPQVHCGTKNECDVIAGWFFLILIAWGLAELFDWLF